MKRLVLAATLSAALLAGGSVAQAHHSNHHAHPHSGTHGKSHRCGAVWRGFAVLGTNGSFTGTTSDNTATGTLTLDVTRANRHARKSGATAGTTINVTLDSTRVILVGFPDGSTLSDLATTDIVKVVGKIEYVKKGGHKNPCTDSVDGIDPGNWATPDTAKIRKVIVRRPSTTS